MQKEASCETASFSALLSMHLPVHLVEDQVLNEPERLAKFRVLVLPNVGYLSDKQQDIIRNYVRNGGSVIANIVYDCGTDAVTPGIVFNQFGKGKVVYISHVPEWLYFNGPDPALLDLFRTLLTLLVPEKFPIEVSGPASLFAFLSEKEKHIVLSLVNYTGETFDGTGNLAQTRIDYIPSIPEVNFRVRLPEKTKPTCVKALVSNKTLKTDFKNNYVCGKIKNVEIFEVIDIGYKI